MEGLTTRDFADVVSPSPRRETGENLVGVTVPEGSVMNSELVNKENLVTPEPGSEFPNMPPQVVGEEGQTIRINCKYPPTTQKIQWCKYAEKDGLRPLVTINIAGKR